MRRVPVEEQRPSLRASDHDPQVAVLCVDAALPAVQVTVTPTILSPPDHRYVTVGEVMQQSVYLPMITR